MAGFTTKRGSLSMVDTMDIDLDGAPTVGMIESVKFVVKEFLDESHLRTLHQVLSTSWSRLHSLSAAMKLMESYGVKLTPEEVEHLSSLDEENQISELVMRMPNQSNEQFQHFFLQLQLLVSTATRVRRALEDGDPNMLEEALNDADSTEIAPYILRIAIVQAGSEVGTLKSHFETWMKKVDDKLGSLLRGQDDAISAQKKLAYAQAQLVQYQSGQVDKARMVLINWGDDFGQVLKVQCFKGWINQWRLGREAGTIYQEYEERIQYATGHLEHYKEVSQESIRSFMRRKGESLKYLLLKDVMAIWQEHSTNQRTLEGYALEVQSLNERLADFSKAQVNRATEVFKRFNKDADVGLMRIVFAAFTHSYEEILAEKANLDQASDMTTLVQKYKKTKSESASRILQGIFHDEDGALCNSCFQGLAQAWQEGKIEAETKKQNEEFQKQVGVLKECNKKRAHKVMEKSKPHLATQILQRMFYAWRLEARVENCLKLYHYKIDAKREQLVGVQQMFRNFAYKLESKLKDSGDTSRELQQGAAFRRKHQQMHRDGGAVSLPDIHAKSRTPQYPGPPDERERRGRRTPSLAASSSFSRA